MLKECWVVIREACIGERKELVLIVEGEVRELARPSDGGRLPRKWSKMVERECRHDTGEFSPTKAPSSTRST